MLDRCRKTANALCWVTETILVTMGALRARILCVPAGAVRASKRYLVGQYGSTSISMVLTTGW